MSRNSLEYGTASSELLHEAEKVIRSVLPSTWRVNVERNVAAAGRDSRLDALLTITAPDGASSTVLIEYKGAVAPRDVAGVVAQIKILATADIGAAMVVTPFVSPMTRRHLDRHGLGWFDATGNMRLRLDHPAVYVDRLGADRNRFRDAAAHVLRSLRGPAAAKVVLELLQSDPPLGVRELANRAEVSVATSARVLDLLDRDAAISRSVDGTVTAVRKRALVDRWTDDYQVMTSNEVVAALDPRGLGHALKMLPSIDVGVVVTGSAAARAYLPKNVTPVSPLVSLSLYTNDPMSLMDLLALRRVERGMNVLVMRPYDDVVYGSARIVSGIRYATPGQVVADLMTGPGRSSEEAEQLMTVLAASEAGWVS